MLDKGMWILWVLGAGFRVLGLGDVNREAM